MQFNVWYFLFNYFLVHPRLQILKYSKCIFTCSQLKQLPWQLHVRQPSYSHFFTDQFNENILCVCDAQYMLVYIHVGKCRSTCTLRMKLFFSLYVLSSDYSLSLSLSLSLSFSFSRKDIEVASRQGCKANSILKACSHCTLNAHSIRFNAHSSRSHQKWIGPNWIQTGLLPIHFRRWFQSSSKRFEVDSHLQSRDIHIICSFVQQ